MKPSMAFTLMSLLLALAATCAVCQNDDVLDTDGQPLRPGVEYFIVPEMLGAGGLVPASRDFQHLFTLDVVQSLVLYKPGLPVSFVLSKETAQLSTDLSIQFESPIWICPSSSKVWKVDYSTSRDVITTNGTVGSYDSFFRIEKNASGNAYKLVHADRRSSIYRIRNVGLFVGELGIGRLALTELAIPVNFQPVNREENGFGRSGLRMFPYN